MLEFLFFIFLMILALCLGVFGALNLIIFCVGFVIHWIFMVVDESGEVVKKIY